MMRTGMIGEYFLDFPKGKNLASWVCHPHDHHFLYLKTQGLPYGFLSGLGRNYSALYETEGRREANLSILRLHELVTSQPVSLTLDDDQIRSLAKAKARACTQIASRTGQLAALAPLSDYLLSMDTGLPRGKTITGVINRLISHEWWQRQIRKIHRLAIEKTALHANIVNRHRGIYASDTVVELVRNQKKRERTLLEETIAVNELGDEFTLAELVDRSVSNPSLRRGEMMLRIRGFEDIAKEKGYIGMFYTLTCPSKMHRSLSKNGLPNPTYDGSTPKESQSYLCTLWARIRASLGRQEIIFFGVRVCEPQHDGTPHWHLLLFISPDQEEKVTETMQDYALALDGDEPGAEKYRFTAISIDSSKGSATGYVAKYISKNIDGFGIDSDLYGKPAESSAVRVRSWASVWGIRQFQFFGSPSVTIWRECRRLRTSEYKGVLGDLIKMADSGDWVSYVELMGGVGCKSKNFNVSLFKGERTELNRYGEPGDNVIIGVRYSDELALTRQHTWTITTRLNQSEDAGDSESQYLETPQNGLFTPVGVKEAVEVSEAYGRRPCATLEYCQ